MIIRRFSNNKFPFRSFAGGKLTKSVFVYLFVLSFVCFLAIIGAVLLQLLKSTVDFRETNIFLSFNFYIFLYIFYNNFSHVPSLRSNLCFKVGLLPQ